jgi:hypothetical protein
LVLLITSDTTFNDNFYRSWDALLGTKDGNPFPCKECVLGFMYTVFLWEEYLRQAYNFIKQEGSAQGSAGICYGGRVPQGSSLWP